MNNYSLFVLFSNVQFQKLKILDLGCNRIKHVSSSDLEKNCVSTGKFCSYSDRPRPGKNLLEDEKCFNHWVEIPFGTLYVLPPFHQPQVLITLYIVFQFFDWFTVLSVSFVIGS